MRLEEANEIIIELGKIVWPLKEELKLEDLMLYGSVSYKKENPRDIDLMVLHQNIQLESFIPISKSKEIMDIEKLLFLQKILGNNIPLIKRLQNTKTLELVNQNLLNLNYLNIRYFSDLDYRNYWNKLDSSFHHSPPSPRRFENETFLQCIFRQGLLWNPNSEKYVLPASEKYDLKNNISQFIL